MVHLLVLMANPLIWISNLLFLTGLFAQIHLNHKIKNTGGLSDFFILGTYNSYLLMLLYTFNASLPLPYKITNSFYFLFSFIILVQRICYLNALKGKNSLYIYIVNLIFIHTVLFLSINNTNICNYLGWLPIVLSLCKKFPQIIKIQMQKNIVGFSLGLIFLTFIGYIFEFLAAILLNLPNQILFNDIKGILVYSIFIAQFILYKNDKTHNKESASTYA